jgi:hypothetical protein
MSALDRTDDWGRRGGIPYVSSCRNAWITIQIYFIRLVNAIWKTCEQDELICCGSERIVISQQNLIQRRLKKLIGWQSVIR